MFALLSVLLTVALVEPASPLPAAACPVPAERLFASFVALRDHTDAEIFAMTCLDDLVEAQKDLGGIVKRVRALPREARRLTPTQAALLLRWADAHRQDGSAVLRLLRESLDGPRPQIGFWTDPRRELRETRDPRSRVVAGPPGAKASPPAATPPGPRAAPLEPLEITVLTEAGDRARVRLAGQAGQTGRVGWVDKRALVLPAVLGFRVPDDRAPLLTFLPLPDELVVLRVEAKSFLLGFAPETPAAGLTLTCDRATGRVTAVGRAPANVVAAPAAKAPGDFFRGRDCVSLVDPRGAGHAVLHPGVEAEGRFFVHGWPGDCRK